MIIMSDREKIYTGIIPLDKALKSVVMLGSNAKPQKFHTIKEQRYNKLSSWMKKYSERVVIEEGKIKVKEKPILPTAEELKSELGMTWGQLKSVARSNDDTGAAFHYRADISEEQKRNLKAVGLTTGLTYVALQSQYPFLSKIFEKA